VGDHKVCNDEIRSGVVWGRVGQHDLVCSGAAGVVQCLLKRRNDGIVAVGRSAAVGTSEEVVAASVDLISARTPAASRAWGCHAQPEGSSGAELCRGNVEGLARRSAQPSRRLRTRVESGMQATG